MFLQKLSVVTLLLAIGTLCVLQAIFYKSIARWHARRVRYYPKPLRGFFLLFPPQGEIASMSSLLLGTVASLLFFGLAFVVAFYLVPARP